MIVFSVQGGITAQDSELSLDPDGVALAVVHGHRTTGHVAPQEVRAILSELDASGQFAEDRSDDPPMGFDLQRYSITYRGATVITYDSVVPPQLMPAITLLENALREVLVGR